MIEEESPVYEEGRFFDRPSSGKTWVEDEEGGMAVVRIEPMPWISAHILPRYHCAEVCACSLTLTNRLNATVFCFAPDDILSADFTAKRAGRARDRLLVSAL